MMSLKRIEMKQKIEEKRQKVRQIYEEFGFHSPEYEKEFDELHNLIIIEEEKYRRFLYG